MPVAEIAAIADPVVRAAVAERQQQDTVERQEALALIRAGAAAELRARGLSYGEIGRLLGGITRERARQLCLRGSGGEEQ